MRSTGRGVPMLAHFRISEGLAREDHLELLDSTVAVLAATTVPREHPELTAREGARDAALARLGYLRTSTWSWDSQQRTANAYLRPL